MLSENLQMESKRLELLELCSQKASAMGVVGLVFHVQIRANGLTKLFVRRILEETPLVEASAEH